MPNIQILTADNPLYPPQLREISDPPKQLYYRGNVQLLSRQMLGIVGPRNPSEYGLYAASTLAKELAPYFLIISGMALGIDAAAHRAALEAGHPTVAVVATGLDRVYPAANERLFNQICEKGLVLSEYPLGTAPLAHHFPQRNRIVSGLSQGVLVAEASQRSGAMITARLAMEQGREVFAVPGSIFSEQTDGVHQLIKDGAKLVHTIQDVVDEFNYLIKIPRASRNPEPKPELNLSPDETAILAQLGAAPLSLEDLVQRCGLSVHMVLQSLTLFEMQDVVEQLPGKLFRRKL